MDNDLTNTITVVDESGNNFNIEVLDIFNVEGYENDYVLYTRNIEVDPENIEAYVSILKNDNDGYSLINIEDNNEWDIVQKAILEMESING